MKHRVLDFILLLAVLIGGVLAWQGGRERGRLSETHRRLAQVTGDLPIADPTKVHVLALETGEPLHFAWRVYFPRNSTLILTDNIGGQATRWSIDPEEFIARVRIREDGKGGLEIYSHFSGGSSRGGFGTKTLADLLRGRWDEVRVEQLGAGGVAAFDPGRPMVLLKLTLPETMRDEARRELDPFQVERHIPFLLKMQLGPTAPKP